MISFTHFFVRFTCVFALRLPDTYTIYLQTSGFAKKRIFFRKKIENELAKFQKAICSVRKIEKTLLVHDTLAIGRLGPRPASTWILDGF